MDRKSDLLEKGAIVQRDYETFAIAPHIPGGVCTPAILRKLADVAEKYGAKALKVTSAQRIVIVGIEEKDIDSVWNELGMSPGYAAGLCVRSVKMCPGTTFCKRGQQDSLGLGMELDKLYHGFALPSKFKIGVSGCGNCCAESWIKDLGFIGTPKGWKVVVGGSAGAAPMIGQEIASGLSSDEAINLTDRILNYYKICGTSKRLGKHIQKVGLDEVKSKALN